MLSQMIIALLLLSNEPNGCRLCSQRGTNIGASRFAARDGLDN
jgi:hypothetical protein